MTTRQSNARRSGKAALATKKPANIGISTDYRAYGVRIDWTSAPVVKITARKEMSLEVIEAAVMRGQLTEGKHIQYKVQEGDTLYFARSSHGAFYYLLRWNGTRFCCSCPAHGSCKHQEAVTAYAQQSAEAHQRMEEEAALAASSDSKGRTLYAPLAPEALVELERIEAEQMRPEAVLARHRATFNVDPVGFLEAARSRRVERLELVAA